MSAQSPIRYLVAHRSGNVCSGCDYATREEAERALMVLQEFCNKQGEYQFARDMLVRESTEADRRYLKPTGVIFGKRIRVH
jgi:hypothetical protein